MKKIGVLTGDFAIDLYQSIPCKVGNKYLRVQVDGGVNPCCVMGTTMGNIAEKDYHEVWFSDSYSVFRERMENIHHEKFHLTDPEWAFCQQCPHSEVNLETYYESEVEKDPKKVSSEDMRAAVFQKIAEKKGNG
ncbi:MAG: SPASM domain-containing protein [Bdellovibrionales bacterium]|nr:SPASM domain-containing protein [Bdellovibrionales bacterium]